jgi:hypothetical protein
MKKRWLYIVTESLPADFWREPEVYSDPLPYGEALALLVELEEQTSREDISFELVAITQP